VVGAGGRVAGAAHAELLARGGAYARMWNLQANSQAPDA
jgi:ABC-type multidrug transport system fused ATPase/permease subunit